MNLTVGTTLKRPWPVVGRHHLTALAVCALMVAGGFAGWRVTESGTSAPHAQAAPSEIRATRYDERYLTLYIVDSKAQRDWADYAENQGAIERSFSNYDSSGISYDIMQFQ